MKLVGGSRRVAPTASGGASMEMRCASGSRNGEKSSTRSSSAGLLATPRESRMLCGGGCGAPLAACVRAPRRIQGRFPPGAKAGQSRGNGEFLQGDGSTTNSSPRTSRRTPSSSERCSRTSTTSSRRRPCRAHTSCVAIAVQCALTASPRRRQGTPIRPPVHGLSHPWSRPATRAQAARAVGEL